MTDHAGIVENHLIDDTKFLLDACKLQRARIAELETALSSIRSMIEATDPHNPADNMKLASRIYKVTCDVIRDK